MLANVGQCWPMLANVGQRWPMLANVGHCWPMLINIAHFCQNICICTCFLKVVLGKRKKICVGKWPKYGPYQRFPTRKNSIGERKKMIIGQWVAAGVGQCLQHGVAQWRWWGVEQRPFLPETIPVTINVFIFLL